MKLKDPEGSIFKIFVEMIVCVCVCVCVIQGWRHIHLLKYVTSNIFSIALK